MFCHDLNESVAYYNESVIIELCPNHAKEELKMLEYLKTFKGSIVINGVEYPNIEAATVAFKNGADNLVIVLNKRTAPSANRQSTSTAPAAVPSYPLSLEMDAAAAAAAEESELAANVASAKAEIIYRVKVRQYMTKPSSPEFDFQAKWNNNVPMPMRIMTGKIIQETKGMYKMEMWGQIVEEQASICMKCGRKLTHPVSKYFGIGPECGGHDYNNPFESDEALLAAVKKENERLMNIRWTGWVIKSAIEEMEVM